MKWFARSVAALLLSILLAGTVGCRLEDDSAPPAAASASASPSAASVAAMPEPTLSKLRVVRIIPDGTKAGVGFNVQGNGVAAISLITENATRSSVVVISGQELATTYGNPNLLTAYVPRRLYTAPGELDVSFADGSRSSNILTFVVTP